MVIIMTPIGFQPFKRVLRTPGTDIFVVIVILNATNLNTMNNFSFIQSILRGLCFLAIQQGITADTNNCKTLKLEASNPLVVTIFDTEYKLGDFVWTTLCTAIKQFPEGLVTVDYRPGSLATGSGDSMKCGSGDCKMDQILGCCVLHSKYYNDCYRDAETDWPGILRCYCTQETNQFLLDNAAMRASWNIPEDAVPTLAMNQVYDPCVKFGSYEDFLSYLCQVYQNKVGNCK